MSRPFRWKKRVRNVLHRHDVLGLPSSFLKDRDVESIESEIQSKIMQSLIYACRSWGYHLEKSARNEGIISSLKEFLNEKIIYWVEVMSLLRQLTDEKTTTIDAMSECVNILNIVDQV